VAQVDRVNVGRVWPVSSPDEHNVIAGEEAVKVVEGDEVLLWDGGDRAQADHEVDVVRRRDDHDLDVLGRDLVDGRGVLAVRPKHVALLNALVLHHLAVRQAQPGEEDDVGIAEAQHGVVGREDPHEQRPRAVLDLHHQGPQHVQRRRHVQQVQDQLLASPKHVPGAYLRQQGVRERSRFINILFQQNALEWSDIPAAVIATTWAHIIVRATHQQRALTSGFGLGAIAVDAARLVRTKKQTGQKKRNTR